MIRPPSFERRNDIQGLRAIAVLAVVVYHANARWLPGGYVGVDVFFVISGFLISSHLLRQLETCGTIDLPGFWARRARRLLPAAFIVILASVCAAFVFVPPLQLGRAVRDAIATCVYVPNMLFAAQGTNYLAEPAPSLFQHFWSLGVEEQFYLLWPIILLVAWKRLQTRRSLAVFVGICIGMSFAGGVVATMSPEYQPYAFFLLPARAWELSVGGLISLMPWAVGQRFGDRPARACRTMGVLLIFAALVLFGARTVFPGYAAGVPVVGAALVIAAGEPTQWSPLTSRVAGFFGEISYSMYLVHWPVLMIPQAAVGYLNPLPLWATVCLVAACVPLAWLLFHVIENRGRQARWLVRARPRRTLAAVLACMALVGGLSAGAGQMNNRRELDSGKAAQAGPLSDPPLVTGYVPVNLTPSLRKAEDSVPVLYDNGCHLSFGSTDAAGCRYGTGSRRVVLFGDSHAAQWYPALAALADMHGLTVETHTKSSCPSVDIVPVRNGATYRTCLAWRKKVIERLATEPPSLVILANYGAPSTDGSHPDRGWAAGLERTIRALTRSPGTRVAVLADTPNLGVTPAICLSSHLEDAPDCGQPRRVALRSPVRAAEAEAIGSTGATPISLLDYMCTAEFCPAIIGNTLVYRDAHHLTTSFSAELATPLWERLAPLLDGLGV